MDISIKQEKWRQECPLFELSLFTLTFYRISISMKALVITKSKVNLTKMKIVNWLMRF